MKAKSKNIVKYQNGGDTTALLNALQAGVGLTPYGAAIQGAIGLGQGIFGVVQANRAKSELEKLNEQRPEIRIPAAIMKLAEQPIAEDIVKYRDDMQRRRTSQAIGAASAMGSRALLGALPTITDQERIGERERMAQYAQAEKDALSTLGQYQQGMQDRQSQQWMNQVAGARAELGAGNQNIYGGISEIGRSLPFLRKFKNDNTETDNTETDNTSTNQPQNKYISSLGSYGAGNVSSVGSIGQSAVGTANMSNDQSGMYDTSVEGDKSNNVLDNLRVRFNPSTGQYEKYNEGGMITDGKFSHKENPIHMVDKNGEKVGEMTGGEVILNPEQIAKVKKESSFFANLLKKFKNK